MKKRVISIGFLMNTKDVHSSVGTMFVCSFPDSQDVKALNKMSASVHVALYYLKRKFPFLQKCTTSTLGHCEMLQARE